MDIKHNRIVVKVGTSTLTSESGESDLRLFDRIARVLTDLVGKGYEMILVSSGAIAQGKSLLGYKADLNSLGKKQAAAAVGQCRLIYLYDKFFSEYGKTIAQILLTAEDIADDNKKQNLINTFESLLIDGIIPIVNENDSVGYDEIESPERLFGDNDMLSAIVAVMCKASRLIILSDVDGLYDRDPHIYPDARLIERIYNVDNDIKALAGGAGTNRGRGGMITKLRLAELAISNGIDATICRGDDPDLIYRIVDGEAIGTLFVGDRNEK
ncbi:MAG: glutamate 5-kinase [Clostridiales bacterium]|nr:glutamate 5-kinase [Clostridiales bacterium]